MHIPVLLEVTVHLDKAAVPLARQASFVMSMLWRLLSVPEVFTVNLGLVCA
jgi:hypothetical protein